VSLATAWFLGASFAAEAVVVLLALRLRSRFYAIFLGVLLTVHGLIASALFPFDRPAWLAFAMLHTTVYVHYGSLIWARMRGPAWRLLVTWPAHFFSGGTLLAAPWALAVALGFEPWMPWLPYALALVGVAQSASARREEVALRIDRAPVEGGPHRHLERGEGMGRPLRVVQITDPHIGPWMSVRRLRRVCERVVAQDPDLVLLTGDFLTMESQRDPTLLAEALAPLSALRGRTYACRGNHDLEAPETVARGLEAAGVQLLVDEATEVQTPVGRVQLVGLDFHFRDRAARIGRVFEGLSRNGAILRLVLLHDPGAFRHVPEGEGDLVLSGHTHGGQLGLVSLGLHWTPVWAWVGMPDHGLFARGRDRLYVHRGTGQYGFPLRLGVPAEESLLAVYPEQEGEP